MGLGKEKRMFTAIRSSYLYLESLKNAALDYEKEWGFSFGIQIRISLKRILW